MFPRRGRGPARGKGSFRKRPQIDLGSRLKRRTALLSSGQKYQNKKKILARRGKIHVHAGGARACPSVRMSGRFCRRLQRLALDQIVARSSAGSAREAAISISEGGRILGKFSGISDPWWTSFFGRPVQLTEFAPAAGSAPSRSPPQAPRGRATGSINRIRSRRRFGA